MRVICVLVIVVGLDRLFVVCCWVGEKKSGMTIKELQEKVCLNEFTFVNWEWDGMKDGS